MPNSNYLTLKTKEARLASFQSKGATLPIDLVEDLLLLDLGSDEKLKLIANSTAPNTFALEIFLVNLSSNSNQDIATFAMRQWAARTNHFFWYRLLKLLQEPILPQRSLYTIIDIAEHLDGKRVLDLTLQRHGLEDMSIAFHGLILHRAVQFNVQHARLASIAQKTIASLEGNLHPENKALPSAIAYALRFDPDLLKGPLEHYQTSESWLDLIKLATAKKEKSKQYPLLWQRQHLTAEHINKAKRWQDIAGVDREHLVDTLVSFEDPNTFAKAFTKAFPLLVKPLHPKLSAHIERNFTNTASISTELPAVAVPTKQIAGQKEKNIIEAIRREEGLFLSGKPTTSVITYSDITDHPYISDTLRRHFFDLALRGSSIALPPRSAEFFTLLIHAWTDTDITTLNELAQVARKQEGILRFCYILTLGRFRGRDEACLKLLDFIRSSEDDDIRTVIKSLADIATPRAGQEIISMLTRPNLSLANQVEAASALSRINHPSLQPEIKAALTEIESRPSSDPVTIQLRDLLREQLLLAPENMSVKTANTILTDDSDQGLDEELKRKIAQYSSLSGEVKRALRTAQFFHNKVHGDNAPGTIDLSPVIDMQYKALELFFRENFEDPCAILINRGILQNKLDVIGYARPIPHAMDDFERYIAQLPIVKTIPFFSGFKLRKMLRAICQFRPGKRFTLDGIKAFALFFLCFSRTECKYHLEHLFPLGFSNNEELYNFVKELHLMQDFRNRAAHEGFHPEAANDIQGIWKATASILEIGTRISQYVQKSIEREFAPVNRSSPIIEKKVS